MVRLAFQSQPDWPNSLADVAGNQVHFHVHVVARLALTPCGDIERCWNEVDREEGARNLVHSK